MTVRTQDSSGPAARLIKAVGFAGRNGLASTVQHAENVMGDPALAEYMRGLLLKTSVPAISTGDGPWNLAPGSSELRTLLDQATLLGRFGGPVGTGTVPPFARVPFNVRFGSQQHGLTSYWVGQGRPIPVSTLTVAEWVLEAFKLAAQCVVTDEVVQAKGRGAEATLTRLVVSSTAQQMDLRVLDPSLAADPGVAPASITYGVTPIPSTGNPALDVAALVGASTLDLVDAVLIMSPWNAAYISAQYGGLGLGVRGGVFAGLPVLTSAAAEDRLILVHASALAVADDGEVAVDFSEHATIEMVDNPTGDSITPTAMASHAVSMFHTDSVAIRVIRRINWLKMHPDGVLMVSGADYAGLGS